MVTFTKLLVIRMVANVRSEFSRRYFILASTRFFSSSSSFKSLGESEKNAISEPEANPENSRSTQARTIAKMAPNPKGPLGKNSI